MTGNDQNHEAKSARDDNDSNQSEGGESTASQELRERVISAVREVYDPEIPVNIHDLGLVYAIDIDEQGSVVIEMTLTAPNCPAAELLPSEVERRVAAVEGVTGARVEIVWEPPWSPDLMSEEARFQLGMW